MDSGLTPGSNFAYEVFAFDSLHHYSAPAAATFVVGCDSIQGNAAFSGSGTSQDPYLICSANQLMQVKYHLSSQFLLLFNLDLSGYGGGSQTTTVSTIGSYDNGTSQGTPFTGIFDGGGKTINNLSIDQSATDVATGLFNYTSGATIKNLTLSNVAVTGQNKVGALIGYALNTNLSNITVSGTVQGHATSALSGAHQIGGIVGRIDVSTGGPTNYFVLRSSAKVFGGDTVGGFVALASLSGAGASMIVNDIITSGDVTQSPGTDGDTFGGILGIVKVSNGASFSMQNCHNTGNVSFTGSWGGGIAGTQQIMAGGGTMALDSCSNTGSVSTDGSAKNASNLDNDGGQCIGGAFGNMVNGTEGGTITVSHLSSIGQVQQTGSNSATGVGGLLGCLTPQSGTATTFSQVYSSGNVSVTTASVSKVGGLVGLGAAPGTSGARFQITDAYSLGTVTAPNSDSVGGLIGQNTGLLTRTYSFGSVTGKSGGQVGGFLGSNWGVSITSSYWNDSFTTPGVGNGDTTGLTGLSISDFAIEDNFVGWNFSSVWADPSLTGYPILLMVP